ncbi:aspartate carbamoyltransferase [Plasmodiophora brassicae]|uniref:aspartate carbamoyltransferase n=1 Tax=Plasmodiophora brassicae TaxID=37360 RepID=A0A0G4J7C5_PLABS|nr:hypothetical protein PBRA_003187 [Plasmodiophora brassicae]SPQ95659.1 unnamed protein product [Plasmodiophora brassicae]
MKTDVISCASMTRAWQEAMFARAAHWEAAAQSAPVDQPLRGRVLATVFYEASSRTSSSFQAAMLRLGGTVVPVHSEWSSVTKGESLEDTMRTMASYADAIVLRHPETGSAKRAADAVPNCPVINAGDGIGEHPTQALLDVYTIWKERPGHDIDGLTVTIAGDLLHGRTVHSLIKLLNTYSIGRINLISPESLRLPDTVVKEIRAPVHVGTQLDDVLPATDVLYMTRIQKERFAKIEDFETVRNSFCLTRKVMSAAKPTCIIMHPLPRNAEIHPELDSDPRSAYFRQMRNGMFVRMAILEHVVPRFPA